MIFRRRQSTGAASNAARRRRSVIFWMGGITAIIACVVVGTGWRSDATRQVDLNSRYSAMGFDLTDIVIDPSEIRSGGPPKDGIPAITRPQFVAANDNVEFSPQERVIGISIGGEARAYPLAILNYHEIVNDMIGTVPIAVTYCPLCDSAAVYDRRTPLGQLEFGVSGLLHNSNVLMFDRRDKGESLWSQVRGSGISGPGARQPLRALPCELTTLASWKSRFPNTLVLSTKTGYQRDYQKNPYHDYFLDNDLMFTVSPVSMRFPSKERILGVWAGDQYRAYSQSAFAPGEVRLSDVVAGKSITIEFDRQHESLWVVHADAGLSWLYSYWFAWYAMHPETTVYGP